ncbi:hypothetical protein [Conchiformibius kuhniae]|uniref:Uncharacterized protein n=1 Tax=Conchiformibius kuhniae TaxID=211502 RepID=A0A8T9MRA6_9NEIS|nr:hypothetical protein [Conchiformibius kuhniae]UOP04420.1 hypothetical protein LVJ77_08950 [Conchiformibius kuhniae]
MPHHALFARLSAVRRVAFHGRGRGWTRCGAGTVLVENISNNILLFHECLQLDGKQRSRDCKRWCLQDGGLLLLQRRRHHGWETIFAFARKRDAWHSKAFYCAPDGYFGSLHPTDAGIELRVRVCGTGKDDVLKSVYAE